MIREGSFVDLLLLGAGLSSAFVTGVIATRPGLGHRAASTPKLTLTCLGVIATVSGAQLVFAPWLLPLMMRDAAEVSLGQPWRLATSLFVQDGGWTGAVFNLVGLLAIGTVAELLLRPRRWAIVAMVSVASAQAAALWWQPVGAGNSILNFGLAGAVCARGWLGGRRRRLLAPAVTASLCFGFLLAGHDIHGVAAISGALVAAALELGWPTQHTHGACN